MRKALLATTALVAFALSVSTSAAQQFATADVQVVSNTPNVRHAKVGDVVEFTVIARNNGPDTVALNVSECVDLNDPTCLTKDGFEFGAMTCEGLTNPSADTPVCEYGLAQPGAVATVTVGARVHSTADRHRSFTACVGPFADEPYVDPDPANDCATATVKIIGKRKSPSR
jgi:hypothetical protein